MLILDSHPLAGVDDEVLAPLHALADRLEGLGAEVSRSSPLLPDLAAAQPVYLAMLGTIMARGRPGADPPLDPFAYMNGLDAIARARAAWAELFEDVRRGARPAVRNGRLPARRVGVGDAPLTINGEPTPYGAQIAWAGIATFGLPSALVVWAAGLATLQPVSGCGSGYRRSD